MQRLALILCIWMFIGGASAHGEDAAPMRILVFSRTAAYRHESIPAGIEALKNLGHDNGFKVDATESAGVFTDDNLARYDVVVFLNTTGDVLNEQQQNAFEAFIRGGKGFVGIHAAADTEYDWPWYGELVGARFDNHPDIQPATVHITDPKHPSTRYLPETWQRTDEWYDFTLIKFDAMNVLATLDEKSYRGGSMGDNHPFAWCHQFDGGRAWYTAGGHTIESYSDPGFLLHVLGGITWAAGTPAKAAATSTSLPIQSRTIGTVRHASTHTWQGVIVVNSDNVQYQDGVITADVSGIPEGITFEGDRKGITFKNLEFRGVGDGLTVGNNQTVDDITLDGCKFIDCRSPDASSHEPLLGSRGNAMFVSGGRNWTIRNCLFKTKAKDPAKPEDRDWSVQYAARIGGVVGLNVTGSRFENWAGKACVWLMFVRAAVFDHAEFAGGPIRIGARPNDMPDIERGDCRNIVFRGCTFDFGVFEDWPASILIFPGSENISFEGCQFKSVPGADWWIDIDSRSTANISWTNCRWNDKPIEGYTGVRSPMSQEQMKAVGIGPKAPEGSAEATPAATQASGTPPPPR